ncbi:MAG: SUMF1/EgtB/PvdO family nonheme iron enzyme [Spirochaetales bacterium]|nr:SUMF1/EgtB/PvdO family nonheme iron enzyme [Spirochaetales bacterium]
MKAVLKVQLIILVFCFVLLACPPINNGGDNNTPTPEVNPNSTPALPLSVQFKEVVTDNVEFLYQNDSFYETIDNELGSFFIAKCELNFKIWKTVIDWAMINGYTFTDGCGTMGYNNNGTTEGLDDSHPVTYISWRDAIVFSNALTDYYNKHNDNYSKNQDLDFVFYSDSSCDLEDIIKNASAISGNPYFKTGGGNINTNLSLCISDGFRICSEREWIMAARWVGNYTVKPAADEIMSMDSDTGNCWYKQTQMSGIYDSENNRLFQPGEIGVFDQDSTSSIASKAANQLGLYDMAGNCDEFIFTDGGGSYAKGGAWMFVSDTGRISRTSSDYTNLNFYYNRANGIRLAKSPSRDALNSDLSIDSQVQQNLNDMFK